MVIVKTKSDSNCETQGPASGTKVTMTMMMMMSYLPPLNTLLEGKDGIRFTLVSPGGLVRCLSHRCSVYLLDESMDNVS